MIRKDTYMKRWEWAGFRIRIRSDPVQISPDPVSAPGSRSKKKAEWALKVIYQRENLKIMTKVRQKMKKATISY